MLVVIIVRINSVWVVVNFIDNSGVGVKRVVISWVVVKKNRMLCVVCGRVCKEFR